MTRSAKTIGIYIMIEFKNGEHVIEVPKKADTKVVINFQNDHKPHELTVEEKCLLSILE